METRKALVVIVWKAEQGSEKRVLVLKLVPERGSSWSSVTGKVEAGESFAEGALREAIEETALPFERLPQYLGLEHRFEGRWGPAHEKCFLLSLVGGDAPPQPKLDPKEHVDFQWLPAQAAAKLVKFPMDSAAITRAGLETPPLYLSRRGAFFQEGEEITHARTAELLHRSLVQEKGGAFKVALGEETLDVVLEDTARFVKSYDSAKGELSLSDGSREILNPTTISIRPDNSMSCKLQNGWEALFLPAAYYEITKSMRPGSLAGEYILHFCGSDCRILVTHKGEGENR